MQTPRAEIARERRRQIQVRKAFDAGLDAAADYAGRDPAAFYLACADYLLFSMARLHEQDQLIHDLLRERMGPEETEARAGLDALDARQDRSRALLEELRAAGRRLRGGGADCAAFEATARRITGEFRALLLPRKNPYFRHTDALFGDADWELIAGVTPASVAREHELFDRIRAAAPRGGDPEGFTAEHLPRG